MQYWWELQKQKEEEERLKAEAEKEDDEEKTLAEEQQETFDTLLQINHTYVTETNTSFKWFSEIASQQIFGTGSSQTEVIIMLGFDDCLHSCRLKHILGDDADEATKEVAKQYYELLNTMQEQYSGIKFYFCSVNPVTEDIPETFAKNGYYTAAELNEQIALFNSIIKEECKIPFIDTADYLAKTSLFTLDGFLYTKTTCIAVQDFITSKLAGFAGAAIGSFVPRLEAPELGSGGGENDGGGEEANFWISTGHGGSNRCMVIDSNKGTVIPNCVGYAWGRFMEILGSTPTLSTSNAENWYGNTSDGYSRGTEPMVGAVICWRKGDIGDDPDIEGEDAGHVAIVEQIVNNDDGSIKYIVTSESGYIAKGVVYNPKEHFSTVTRYYNGGRWHTNTNYHFQGFIYNPRLSGVLTTDFVSKLDVTARNDYLTQSEMQKNARYIWQYLGSKGWSLNAVAGMLGNMESESTISPCRYEVIKGASIGKHPTREEVAQYFEDYKANNTYYKTADSTGSRGRYPGIGLTGWTFSDAGKPEDRVIWSNNKLVKWCDERKLDFQDMDSNLERIIYEKDHGMQWHTGGSDYKISFKEFSTSLKPAYWLAGAFLDNYENPASPNFEVRGKRGDYWFNYLLPYAPGWGYTFEVKSFKLDHKDTTTAKASFIVTMGEKGHYRLLDENDKEIIGETELDVQPEKPEEPEKEEKESTSDTEEPEALKPQEASKVVVLEFENLKPNTKYKIELCVEGKKSGEEEAEDKDKDKDSETADKDDSVFEEILEFITEQSYPQPVQAVLIDTTEKFNFPSNTYILKVTPPADWGYWRNNGKHKADYGYTISLLLNGQVVNKLSFDVKTISNLSFIPDILFPLHLALPPKMGDSMQISVNTWTTDSNNVRIYRPSANRASNTICFINKPYKVFLNRDDV